MDKLFSMAFILMFMILLTTSAVLAEPVDIQVQRYNNPAQKKFAYAGKLYWDPRLRKWEKKIVVYNRAPIPKMSHPVWSYVLNLKTPKHYGVKGKDEQYKNFYLKANCTGKTPLAEGKPWYINFDKNAKGRYTNEEFRQDWNCPDWQMGRNLINVVADKSAYSGHSLRIHYPSGISGCYSPKHCVNWKPELGGKFEKLYYGYRFKFPKGFRFVKGGKLPGVGGGISNTNGDIPNGADGWSVRMMWDKDGKLVQYVYHPDQPSKYGDVMPFDMDKLELGKWHTVQTMVMLNKPGHKNGVVKSWLDGKLVLNKQGMRFRNVNRLEIDRLLFASFFGGSGPYWAPQKDEYAFIDDIRISTKPVFYSSHTLYAKKRAAPKKAPQEKLKGRVLAKK